VVVIGMESSVRTIQGRVRDPREMGGSLPLIGYDVRGGTVGPLVHHEREVQILISQLSQ
jgi:hypothetical protein